MPNAFKPLLNKEAERAISEEKHQEKLHEKYKDVPKDTKIVENGFVKTSAKVFGVVVRTLIEIVVFLFAAVGILSLIFPSTRSALFALWSQFVLELGNLFG